MRSNLNTGNIPPKMICEYNSADFQTLLHSPCSCSDLAAIGRVHCPDGMISALPR